MPGRGKGLKCPNPKGYMMTVIDGELVTKPAPCREPDCPVCGKVIRKDIIQRLDNGFRGFRNRMVTLTRRPGCPRPMGECISRFKAYLSRPRLSARDHQKHLQWFSKGRHQGLPRPKLRKRAPLRRQRCFWMKEPHPGDGANHGQLHAHMAVSVFVPKRILDHAWQVATDGYGEFTYVNAGKEDIIKVGRYASKYITKTLAGFHEKCFRKYERRYSFTHHPEFRKVRFTPAENWKFLLNRDAHVYGLPNLELHSARAQWLHLRDPGDPAGHRPASAIA